MKCHLLLDRSALSSYEVKKSLMTSWIIALFLLRCSVNNLLDLATFVGIKFSSSVLYLLLRAAFE